ncbi:prenyltransferase [bacterium]|nr:prenyltransferase [bacterium]
MQLSLVHLSESRWRVLQPAIYLVSLLPAWVCWLTFKDQASGTHALVLGCSVVLIQHAINVFNDGIDWQKGADGEKQNSWVHFHQGQSSALKIHAWTSLWVGLVSGILVVQEAHRWEVLWVALPLVVLGLFYNHSHWTLAYTKWGEWVTGICYGPGVFGCMAYVLNGKVSIALLLGSLAFSCLAVSVLLSHQPPQVLTDFAAGKQSFAVRYGVQKTYRTARLLFYGALLFLISLTVIQHESLLVRWSLLGLMPWILMRTPRKPAPPDILKWSTVFIGMWGFLSLGSGA